MLYVAILVGLPFVFWLYLAMSNADVATPVARSSGWRTSSPALENAVFYTALRNTLLFTVVSAILKGLLGTFLAFLLAEPFRARKLFAALVILLTCRSP